ncbi:MAG: lysozyme inhibitor LprI family protein [Mesorhizobium sp.]|nr:MAG: lysozyme inhibitor LprI family protein [Mesorhizobium sp.]
MRRMFLSACLVLLAAASIARAQECDRSDDSQQMMNICAGEDYQAADAKLNKAYQDLTSSDDAGGKRLLQVAQRAWITFRDAECAHSTAASQGGSIHPMAVSQCLTRLTNDRIKQLAAAANCEEGDVSCANPGEDESDDLQ